ncbi:hypothetical protein ACFOOK_26205 [Micromonospora krabiensis]|nr:hypothetical protein [Micromonospora krabiensis]
MGVILVDPLAGHDTAVNAIRAILPAAHPDAVEHWVEAVIPTARPLTSELPPVAMQYRHAPPASLKPGRHRYQRQRRGPAADRAVKMGVRAGSLVAASVLGAVVAPMLTGQGVAPVSAATAWSNPVFEAVQTGSGMNCSGVDDADLVATCVAEDGAEMQVEAMIGPDQLSFTFNYEAPDNGKPQRNVMKVFASAMGVESWRAIHEADPDTFQNLIMGERWVLYGTDETRLRRWAHGLDNDTVLPADMTEAAVAMKLLPDPRKPLRLIPHPKTVGDVILQEAVRIIVGDASATVALEPEPVIMPAVPVIPTPPPVSTTPPVAPPATPPTAPPPPPTAPVTPPTTPPAAPTTPPTTQPTTPTTPPVTQPSTELPAPPPVTTDPTGEVPNGEPVTWLPEGEVPEGDPENCPPAEPPTTEQPVDQEPPATEQPVVDAPPTASDPLNDPVTVPVDEATPVFDEVANPPAPPIFGEVVALMAKHGGLAHAA